MKNLTKRLSDLINVKTIVTFVVISVFAALSINGRIPEDNVMIVVASVISFYFGTQHEKKDGNSDGA